MQNASKYYADYLEMTRVLFANIEKHPDIKTKIAAEGYDDPRLAEGSGLRQQFETLYRTHLEKFQDRLAAYKRVQETRDLARITYGDLVKRLRSEFLDNKEIRDELGLNGSRLTSKTGFIEQATHFYNVLTTHTNVQTSVAAIGLTPEAIGAAAATLSTYQTDLESYQDLKGQCQQLVVDRNKAFRTVRKWINTLITTLRSLFRDNPQTLEKLNIFVRNSPSKKKTVTVEEEPPTEPGTTTDPVTEPVPVTNPEQAAA